VGAVLRARDEPGGGTGHPEQELLAAPRLDALAASVVGFPSQRGDIALEEKAMGEARRKFDPDFREGAVRLVREKASRSRRWPGTWGSSRRR
jgi:hypothetical protein